MASETIATYAPKHTILANKMTTVTNSVMPATTALMFGIRDKPIAMEMESEMIDALKIHTTSLAGVLPQPKS